MTHKLCTLSLGLAACLLTLEVHAAEINTTSTLRDREPSDVVRAPTPQFSKVIEDLPLMEGLTQDPDEDVLFVTPKSGRIAESVATGEYNFK